MKGRDNPYCVPQYPSRHVTASSISTHSPFSSSPAISPLPPACYLLLSHNISSLVNLLSTSSSISTDMGSGPLKAGQAVLVEMEDGKNEVRQGTV